MINLPEWKLTLCEPLYDTSSKSPIEMTAQVYGKMREVVNAHNEFTKKLSEILSTHIEKTNGDISEFETKVTCIANEYIESIDTKFVLMQQSIEKHFDETISKAVENAFIKYDEERQEIVVGGSV